MVLLWPLESSFLIWLGWGARNGKRLYGWVARSGDRPQVGRGIGSTVGWLGRETGHRLVEELVLRLGGSVGRPATGEG